MIRALLINPTTPEKLSTPLLGLQYVAAALLAQGCEVRVIDAAARNFNHDTEWILAETESCCPDFIGIGLSSRWVVHAYRLAERLQGRVPLLIAGGPHATVRPTEALEHGFDIIVTGEAEKSIARLADWLEGRARLEEIPGICYRAADGRVCAGPPAAPIEDLDALPPAYRAQSLFNPYWYDPSGREVVPGGIVTSRGCPARCTFCANYVTGRKQRNRSPRGVVEELNANHARCGATFFPFWDDALTANRTQLRKLCNAIRDGIGFALRWSAITQASMVTPAILRAMKQAGCVAINFGVESGDEEILRRIGKRLTTRQVHAALEWAKNEGLLTTCNFMLGFPQETPQHLEHTLRFMEEIAPLVDSFSTLGVVVPFPGTPLYEEFHAQYGFTEWWLREERCCNTILSLPEDSDQFREQYADDPVLELDFFRYSDEMRRMIRACLRFKAAHNLHKMGLSTPSWVNHIYGAS